MTEFLWIQIGLFLPLFCVASIFAFSTYNYTTSVSGWSQFSYHNTNENTIDSWRMTPNKCKRKSRLVNVWNYSINRGKISSASSAAISVDGTVFLGSAVYILYIIIYYIYNNIYNNIYIYIYIYIYIIYYIHI